MPGEPTEIQVYRIHPPHRMEWVKAYFANTEPRALLRDRPDGKYALAWADSKRRWVKVRWYEVRSGLAYEYKAQGHGNQSRRPPPVQWRPPTPRT